MSQPLFLTLAQVIDIHSDQIERYGGRTGVRDWGLLHSALAQPEGTFSGEWLHLDLFNMAAAYAYHICLNHPFFDGNKRTALAAALIFLELNGMIVEDPKGHLVKTMILLASGKVNKEQMARLLAELSSPSSS